MPKDSVIKKDPAEQACSSVGYGKDSPSSYGPSGPPQLAAEHIEGVMIHG